MEICIYWREERWIESGERGSRGDKKAGFEGFKSLQ